MVGTFGLVRTCDKKEKKKVVVSMNQNAMNQSHIFLK